MNKVRQIRELNKKELENGVSPEASWHTDYRDTAYIYIGGLPFELSEGDIVTIFSQYGEPTYINLVRDRETGKSRGFAFLKYEDQRSTDLAIDNLGGTVIMGRTLSVDHTRYKKKDDEAETGIDLTRDLEQDEDGDETMRKRRRTSKSESEGERPMIKEEQELGKLIQDHDDEDPMKAYLIKEKREEVALALAKVQDSKKSGKGHKHRHRHEKSIRSEEVREDKDADRSRCRDDRDRRISWSREPSSVKDAESTTRRRRRSESANDRRDDYNNRRRESPRRGDSARDRRNRADPRHELRSDSHRSRRVS